uniref:Uncharacterized protein n=1 Tax=Mycobacterium riyadhense TaxID=486698 RepID=A0A653EV30_9MYCO|nr:hypothetical protein BIN_B_03953 [Mycobacterium riyadhense]
MLGTDPQILEHLVFVGVGGAEDLGLEVMRDLNGGLTDPAGAGVDEHPLASAEPGQLDQGDVGRQKRHRHRRGLAERQSRRDGNNHPVIGDRGGREGVVGEQPHHRVTGSRGGHIGGGVDDDAGGFRAEPFVCDGA